MKLKFTLVRPGRDEVDLVAVVDQGVTLAELAGRIAASDPTPGAVPAGELTFAIDRPGGAMLQGSSSIADSRIRSGERYRIVPQRGDEQGAAAGPVGRLEVVEGPDRGKTFPLRAGTTVIGRESDCDVVLSDPLISRHHARLVAGDALEVVDNGSVNGVFVAGAQITRAALRPGDVVEIGDTRFTVQLLQQPGVAPLPSAQVSFNRSPRLAPRFEGVEVDAPEPPVPPRAQRLPMIPLLAPLVMGGILFAVTHSKTSLIFIGLSPLMMLGNVLESRFAGKRQHALEIEQYRADLADIDREATERQQQERAARLAENPSIAELVQAVSNLSQLLWTRRPEDEEFGQLRLGLGRLPSRSSIVIQKRATASRELANEAIALAEKHREIDGVPVVEGLSECGSLGVAGPRQAALPVARSLVAQAVALHSPAEVVIAGCASTVTNRDWDWLKWLPHSSSPHSPLTGHHLASTAEDTTLLIGRLEQLVGDREAAKDDQPLPAVIAVVDDPAIDRARLVGIAERGREVGVHAIWLAGTVDALPAACRTFIEVVSAGAGEGSAAFVRTGTSVAPLAVEPLSADSAQELAVRLAPIEDAGAPIDDDSDLPAKAQLLELTSPDFATSAQALVANWQVSSSILRGPKAVSPADQKGRKHALGAVVGVTSAGQPHKLDLRSDGPHALVGGTTGSGKSEFLIAWILSLAATYSPQRVNFLFVDFKGESTFAECNNLPHAVGLVSDLSPAKVRRTLTSLRAEITRREHLFRDEGVSDLMALERRGDPNVPPSLIIVVDEFAALIQAIPEFGEGVVDVGQRGRSLGMHMILATQRPAGVIKENVRANTNLRIALRVADEADSIDVVGSPVAATFSNPGRAVVKVGASRLTPFQSAYAGDSTGSGPRPAEIGLSELRFGRGRSWGLPDESARDGGSSKSDMVRLVERVREAALLADIGEVRPPMTPVLPDAIDLRGLYASLARSTDRPDKALSDEQLVYGVQDDPERQAQPLAVFEPAEHGHLVVYGTGGSGKSGLLRTIASAAGFTRRGGPCHVYGLDFASRGLYMLEELPHVGSIVNSDDQERVVRLVTWLRGVVDERAARYADAGSLEAYREKAGRPNEPRIILLLDGVAAFRQAYENIGASKIYEMLIGIAADGRGVGVHLVVSADRPASLPPALGASIQRRVVLHLADESEYSMLSLPSDVITVKSPPGRALVDGLEAQIAILGGSPDIHVQAEQTRALARVLRDELKVAPAPPIQRLADLIPAAGLPAAVGGLPVLGMDSESLAPIGFEARGTFVVTGPPGSGRTSALLWLRDSLRRSNPGLRLVYVGSRRSPLADSRGWDEMLTSVDEIGQVSRRLGEALQSDAAADARVALFVEGVPEFVGSPADMAQGIGAASPLQELVKRTLELEGFVVGEGETSGFTGSQNLTQLFKSHRAGIVLQPDQSDGIAVFKTNFPRCSRADFPIGRGLYVSKGKARVVQLPLVD